MPNGSPCRAAWWRHADPWHLAAQPRWKPAVRVLSCSARASRGRGREPVEFGALPVRSFGDAIQHPMHGLIGAVVVGPPNSEVCADNSFGNTRLSADMCVPAAAPRRPRRYVDHVLLVQDAVNTLQGDMPVRNLSGAEEPDDYGMKALNFTAASRCGRGVAAT